MNVWVVLAVVHIALSLFAARSTAKSELFSAAQKRNQFLLSLFIPLVGPAFTLVIQQGVANAGTDKFSDRYVGQSIDESPDAISNQMGADNHIDSFSSDDH